MKRTVPLFLLLSILLAPVALANIPITLKGSPGSMLRQNNVATQAGYTFVETATEMQQLVARGELVLLTGNADYTFREGMSSGVARPEMRLFIERLAAQYHEGTGERLVVTSLTRPSSRQPKNSHALSVHPTGIAVDLRVSQNAKSRRWLESVLLSLERQGVLDVTRERYPPHYHVALFPEAYLAHVEGLIGVEALTAALTGTEPEQERDEQAETLDSEQVPVQEVTMTVASEEKERKGYLLPISLLVAFSIGAIQLRRLVWRKR